MEDLSQIAISLPYLTEHKKGLSGHKQLEQLICCYTAPREAWKLVGQVLVVHLCNPCSTVLKRVCDKLFTIAVTDVACLTACASHTRWLRDKHSHPDLLRWSSHSSPPLSCTSGWCWTSLPECILQWTQNPELSGHEREVSVLTGLMKNQSKFFMLSPLEWPETQLSAWRSRNAAHLPLSFTNAKLSKAGCWKDGLSELVKHLLQCSTFLSHHRNLSFMCQSSQLWYFSQRTLHRAHHLNPDNCKKLSLIHDKTHSTSLETKSSAWHT